VPGDLATPTGGYAYDRRVIAELSARGWRVDVVDLGGGFPFPDDAQRIEVMQRLAVVERGCPLIIDGLAFGAMAEEAVLLGARHPLVALVHHPLALESGLAPDVAEALRESERRALAFARRAVVTSAQTAEILANQYDMPRVRIVIAQPGRWRAAATMARCACSRSALCRRARDMACCWMRWRVCAICRGA